MLDRFEREIDYLRVSVIDRCNQKCIYCMPPEGVDLKPREDIMSFEEIEAFVRAAVELGIRKVRLTGGEPLIRRDIDRLIVGLSSVPGLNELSMTTNGVLLAGLAGRLKASGLDRVNISLDTLDSVKYREITRGGNLDDAVAGVDAAVAAGLAPVKINMVIFSDTAEKEVSDMLEFCRVRGVNLQKIMQFSLYDRADLIMRFHAERPPRCADCNRLRLTADGFIKPCLFSEREIKVDFDDIESSIVKAVQAKPQSGSACANRGMSEIGG